MISIARCSQTNRFAEYLMIVLCYFILFAFLGTVYILHDPRPCILEQIGAIYAMTLREWT